MLAGSIFKDEFFGSDGELLNDLAPSRWMDWSSNPAARIDFPAHATVQSMQSFALLALVSPQVLQRVYDAELKSKADDKFTAAELISRVRDALGVELSLRTVFEAPSVSELSAEIERLLCAKLEAMSEEEVQRTLGMVEKAQT